MPDKIWLTAPSDPAAAAGMALVYAAGYAFSLFVGSWAVRIVVELIEARPSTSSVVLGLVERTLYTTAVVANAWGFFPVWLTMKTLPELASRWGERQRNETADFAIQRARRFFNRFLVGTGLSLLYGIVGGMMIAKTEDWLIRLLLGALLLMAPRALVIFAR